MPGSSPMVVKIIRGAPGVGKSTIAQKVASKLSTNKVAHISVDALQHFDCRAAASKDKLKLGVFHAVLVTRSFISEGFSVVVDYVFDENLDFFIEKLFKSHSHELAPCRVQVFYLDASIEVLKSRNASRPDPMPEEILTKLYDRINKTRGVLGCEVVLDAGAKNSSPGSLAKTIVSCDSGGWTAWESGDQPFAS